MAEICSYCGNPVTDCICNIDIRESRPKSIGGGDTLMRLRWPVPEGTRISQVFGANPAWYTISKGHDGVDFGTVVDTPADAMKEGDVIVARNDGKTGYGRHVRIQHDNGISIYGHLHVIQCAVGDHVEAGQQIGLTGGSTDDPGSGWSTGPHLHAEYRLTGVPNPVPGGYVYNAIDILPLLTNTFVRIVDVSSWDDPIQYGEYEGVIPRCYTGTSKDTKFEIHKIGAKAAGKPWWAYSFYNFLFPAAPQARAVADILSPDKGNIPPYWDVEEWRYWNGQEWIWHKYPGREPLLDGMFTLYDTYKTLTGLATGFYLNPATVHYLKPIPSWLLLCSQWLAHWGTNNPDYEPWNHYTFHQYEGEPDHSRFFGTDAEYLAYVNGTPPPPPPSQELPEFFYPNGSYGYINIRKEPNPSSDVYVVGTAKNNGRWKPIDKVIGTDGNEYWKINEFTYVAKWLTRW